MQIVNGYVCQNCSDVALAKKDIDPAHPDQGTANADASGKSGKTGGTAQGSSQPGFAANAVAFGGALGQANANSPVLANVIASYQQGGQVNVTA